MVALAIAAGGAIYVIYTELQREKAKTEALARHLRKLEGMVWAYNIRPRGRQEELSEVMTDTEDEESASGECISDSEEEGGDGDTTPHDEPNTPPLGAPLGVPRGVALRRGEVPRHHPLAHHHPHPGVWHRPPHTRAGSIPPPFQQHPVRSAMFAVRRSTVSFGSPVGESVPQPEETQSNPQVEEVMEETEIPDVISFDSGNTNLLPLQSDHDDIDENELVSQEDEHDSPSASEEPEHQGKQQGEEQGKQQGEEQREEQREEQQEQQEHQGDQEEFKFDIPDEELEEQDKTSARVYADNYKNRKLGRVGQSY